MTQLDETLLRKNLTLNGDGNVVGNSNDVVVIKQSTEDYIVQIGELNLTVSTAELHRILLRSTTIADSQVGIIGDGTHIEGDLHIHNVARPTPETIAPFQVPNPPEPFVGRQAIRETLATRLLNGEVILLCGIGGIGKTALAKRVAHDLIAAQAFPDGVLWVPLENNPTNPVYATITLSHSQNTAT